MRDFRSAGSFSRNTPKVRANEQIRAPQIRLIGSEGQQVGIVSVKEALEKAQEEGLDLVEVAPLAKPPVCRIMDLGKYLYTLSKKEKESRKKQKFVSIKEIKMTPKIGEHDYQTKLRAGRGFIERGDKVKLTILFRGREITHVERGRKIVDRFHQDLSDIAALEKDGGLEGRALQTFFAPIPGRKSFKKKSEGTETKPEPPKPEQINPGLRSEDAKA